MEHPISASPLRHQIPPPSPPSISPAASTIATTSAPVNFTSSSKPPSAYHNPPPSFSSASSISSASTIPLGVVVVGFIGSRPSVDLTHLINRLLDDNVFGSGNLDKDLLAYPIPDEIACDEENWLDHRSITYHHEPEKGMVFLHYSASSPLRLLTLPSSTSDGSLLDEIEADDLRSMLLMFSVCHVIVFVHEGLRFNVQILQKFRMLQAAKHALSPFVRSQITPLVSSKQSFPISHPNVLRSSSISPPTPAFSSRHGSAISLMSGNGSHLSMLPGQCIPAILFVFEDDFLDGSSPLINVDETTDTHRQNLPLKGSGSVVMLARPPNKAEGSFRRRLQSSLEAQIRFLIKKCRILAGIDHIHSSSRGVGNAYSLPLFLLDASRVVALLDRSVNQRGEPLNFITSLIEEASISKDKLDAHMLESRCENLHNEDVQSIKDFIVRQSDMLRGRGGLPSNVSGGSVAGVGVVAAAAAAAASAASGKLASAPELPSFENWFTVANKILVALLSVGHCLKNVITSIPRFPLQWSSTDLQAVKDAISCLESSKILNMKFSTSWCQRALPAAKEVYLKDLPRCYPTTMHNKQLEKALIAFHSMVKGPVVKMFTTKLADQCTSIWEAGRQLCDAVSLTGKHCIHRRHEVAKSDSFKEGDIIQHSSGYVFLHACACGRSRQLRADPFKFEDANITFNHFAKCDNLLPSLFLSDVSNRGLLPPTSWSLLRVGGASYYEPSKGLLQTGFCSSQKFLMKWTISTDKQDQSNIFPIGVTGKGSEVSLNFNSVPKMMPSMDEGKKKSTEAKFNSEVQLTSESLKKSSDLVQSNAPSISFGRGLPLFTMKKPFAEVVAGMANSDSTPIALEQRKHTKYITDKGIWHSNSTIQNDGSKNSIDDHQASQGPAHVSALGNAVKLETNCQTNGNPYVQIGTNIVPVDILISGEKEIASSSKQSTIYVGFEHECSYGHRFLLSLDHLKNLDSSYVLSSKSHSSINGFEGKNVESKNGVHEILDQYSSRKANAATNTRNANKLIESAATSNGQIHESFREGMEKFESIQGLSMFSEFVDQLGGKLSQVRLDDGSSAFSLLTRNLPVYMNCPHCSNSGGQTHPKIKFASKVSQLQRIFLVTPPFPTVLATCPVIQFEESFLPPSTPEREQQSRFSPGCWAVLPPESFLTLRLPFIYGVRNDDETLHPLSYFEDRPELTAWLAKGTTLQVVSLGHESFEETKMR